MLEKRYRDDVAPRRKIRSNIRSVVANRPDEITIRDLPSIRSLQQFENITEFRIVVKMKSDIIINKIFVEYIRAQVFPFLIFSLTFKGILIFSSFILHCRNLAFVKKKNISCVKNV